MNELKNLIKRKFGTIQVQAPRIMFHFGAFIHPMVTILWVRLPAEIGHPAECWLELKMYLQKRIFFVRKIFNYFVKAYYVTHIILSIIWSRSEYQLCTKHCWHLWRPLYIEFEYNHTVWFILNSKNKVDNIDFNNFYIVVLYFILYFENPSANRI